MSNCCTDTVIFYSEAENNVSQISKLADALSYCYPVSSTRFDTRVSILLDHLDITEAGLYIRGDVLYYEINENSIRLDVDAAWRPLYYCYQAVAEHFNLQFVMQSEEPGCSIFINTDIFGEFLPTRYRVFLPDEAGARGTVYEELYQNESNHEQYLSSEEDVFAMLSPYGFCAEDIPQLISILDTDYVRIDSYETSFE